MVVPLSWGRRKIVQLEETFMHVSHVLARSRTAFHAALLCGLAALASPAAAQQLTPFKFGISAPVVTILPVWMAEAGGFNAKEGLKVEVINMEGGTRGVQVLLSGEIQAMHVGLAVVAQANKAGADLRLVSSSANTLPMTIFTKPEIKTAAQLKGKTFGISTFGSETDIAISIFLKQNGMTRSDVTISQIGGSSQRYGALVAGRIDAALLLEPTVTMAKEKGFNPLLDLAAAKTPWIFDGVVVRREYLNKNRETLTKFMRAYIEGARLALSDAAKAKEVISQRFKTKDTKVIDATYNDFKRLMPPDAAPSVEGAKNVLAQLQAVNIDVGSKDVKDYLDDSIIQKLKQDGFFARMDKEFPVK
jgi:NitT/TauT family transport system substrate-binding protein